MSVYRKSEEHGFSLVELSIVLIVVSVLLGSSLLSMTQVREQRLYREAESQLDQIRNRLIGHAMSYGFLPCPMSLSRETTRDKSDGKCLQQNGAVDASLMGGMGASDAAGRLLDPWHRPVRYALSDYWSSAVVVRLTGVSNLQANLTVCLNSERVCAEHSAKDAKAVFVLLSTGSSDAAEGLQRANLDDDHLFQQAPVSSNEQYLFDDHLIWISKSEMIYWLVRSGQLP